MSNNSYFQIDVDSSSIERLQDIIAGTKGKRSFDSQLRISIGSILKRTRSSMKTAAWNEVKGIYEIKQENFYNKRYTRVKNTYTSSGEFGFDTGEYVAEIEFSGEKIPLSKFDVYGNQNNEAVKKSLIKGKSRTEYKDAFYARINGHLGVFERMGKDRLPIREITSLSTAQMVGSEETLDKITDKAIETIDTRVEHEITRILNGYGMDWRT